MCFTQRTRGGPGSFRVMRRAVKCAVTRIWRQKQKQATVDREVNS